MTGAQDIEREAMLAAAAQLRFSPRHARLVSSSSRMMWHLPDAGAALAISRVGAKSLADVEAEASAVQAAVEAGVRTPPLLAPPLTLDNSRHALTFGWIEGQPIGPDDWRTAVTEAAKVATAEPSQFRLLAWPAEWPRTEWSHILGPELFVKLELYSHRRSLLFGEMIQGELTPAHCDLQPGNFLRDAGGHVWLIDFEHASLAPRSWDPAKLMILARRFGDPGQTDELLELWPQRALMNISVMEAIQEVMLVGWLTDMALNGTASAQSEACARAASLDTDCLWHHLA